MTIWVWSIGSLESPIFKWFYNSRLSGRFLCFWRHPCPERPSLCASPGQSDSSLGCKNGKFGSNLQNCGHAKFRAWYSANALLPFEQFSNLHWNGQRESGLYLKLHLERCLNKFLDPQIEQHYSSKFSYFPPI